MYIIVPTRIGIRLFLEWIASELYTGFPHNTRYEMRKSIGKTDED